MKSFLKGLFFLTYFFSFDLSTACANDSNQAKLYFFPNELEILENVIYIHLGNSLIETNAIRTDQQGFFIFESDITNYQAEKEKKWKCPYCQYWSPIGKKCQNPECPTNRW